MSTAANTWPDANRREAWAREQLEVSQDASSHDALAALLKQIERDELVPDDFLLPAYKALVSPPQQPSRKNAAEAAFVAGEEQRLCEQVGDYARGMFDLPLDERRRRWQKLADECSGSAKAAARLHAISAGLAVDFDALDKASPQIQQLARWCSELLILPPPQRAERRRDISVNMTEQPAQWKSTARRLSKRHSAFARLSPTFVRTVADWGHVERTARRAQRSARLRAIRNRLEDNAGSVIVILVVVIAIVVIAIQPDNDRRDRRKLPSIKIPADQWRSALDPNKTEQDASSHDEEWFRRALEKDEDDLTMGERTAFILAGVEVGSEEWKQLHADALTLKQMREEND